MLEDWLRTLISEFGQQAANKLQGDVGQPEAAIRGPVEKLLTNFGQATGLEVVVHDEADKVQPGARLDFAVRVSGAVTGHVELKKPNENLHPAKFRGHNKKQWERLKDLPNLLYTNGTDWRLYRHGELQASIAFDGDLRTAGADLDSTDLATETFFRTFLKWSPPRSRPSTNLSTTWRHCAASCATRSWNSSPKRQRLAGRSR